MKIVPPENVSSLCEKLHAQGSVLVFTNGVFDLLHPGHIQYLREARRLGSHLIVALNTDDSTRRIKGEKRPLMSLEERAEILAAMEMVSYVTWFDEETPENIIRAVRPDVLVKGGDWPLDQIAGRDFMESYSGRVLSIPFVPGYSTSNIVEKITKLPKA
ncbi:D-glycero-beta-D-manno-heptose 1-phosphate adenylyltransferase [bacterium]|nr:D-glycero-beta-D-manno-heptose 1-phosphate adenylyltransferase [bacterium]MCI0602412.1 D-glycero-beta-D-manno-heptose 1-phosphate adenylyltransferase [bacterium]